MVVDDTSYNFRDILISDTPFIFTPIQVRTPVFDYTLPAFWTHGFILFIYSDSLTRTWISMWISVNV
ncbi:unnamed protein product [Rhizophagus irregularis]|nr:unnamed protein product [Rhizophagus irregularis]